MKNYFFGTVFLFVMTMNSFAQKTQRIGYIDMDYILLNVPEYLEAQNTLDAKVQKWKSELDKEARAIEVMKSDLNNEKAILTPDLIEEREEDITVKQQALRKLESLYFGPNGDMYNLRKKLIQPVQDQVYNAVQTIASRQKFDFVFDKSSELVMLYSNKKYDISELVVKLIDIDQKKQAKFDKIAERKKLLNEGGISDEMKEKLEKKEALKQKKLEEREAKLKQIEELRQKRLQAKEEQRKLLLEKREALIKAREEAQKAKASGTEEEQKTEEGEENKTE